MTCHAAVVVRLNHWGNTVVGVCGCGKKTGELVYAQYAQRQPTIDAALVVLRLLHLSNERK